MKINPYFNFPGQTEKAFTFYKSVFGGDIQAMLRFKDTPQAGPVPENEQNLIMHAAFPVGPVTFMATDALESMGHTVKQGNQITLSVEADSKEEADRIFNGLAAGGKVGMPIADMFWGSYWGQLHDKFGVPWMVNYTPAKN
jgi:PhnB protein